MVNCVIKALVNKQEKMAYPGKGRAAYFGDKHALQPSAKQRKNMMQCHRRSQPLNPWAPESSKVKTGVHTCFCMLMLPRARATRRGACSYRLKDLLVGTREVCLQLNLMVTALDCCAGRLRFEPHYQTHKSFICCMRAIGQDSSSTSHESRPYCT